jgi:hypothetical protein
MLRWESTTPFGVPSEPEVNRIAAHRPACARPAASCTFQAAQLVAERDGRADVFEIDDLDGLRERAITRRACPSR